MPWPEKLVVIDVSGGVVQAVFSNVDDVDLVLVDWDNIKAGDPGAVDYGMCKLEEMPDETRELVEKLFNADTEEDQVADA